MKISRSKVLFHATLQWFRNWSKKELGPDISFCWKLPGSLGTKRTRKTDMRDTQEVTIETKYSSREQTKFVKQPL